MLLPSATFGGVPTRREGVDDAAQLIDYNQYWIDGADGTMLSLQTDLLQSPTYGGEPVDVAPWDSAFYPPMSADFAALVLVDPAGLVTLWSNGLEREQLLTIATSLRPRTDGSPGWDATLPARFTPVHEGWAFGAASRTLQWSDAELWIVSGVPSVISNPGQPGTFDRLTNVGDAPALMYVNDSAGWSAITWTPAPDVVILFGARRAADDLLAAARSLSPVDSATWTDASTIAREDDGCNSLFFC